MAKLHATRLRENTEPLAAGARIIDANFTVVGDSARPKKKKGWFHAAQLYLLALVIAAALGFIVPPLFVLVGELTR
jgi:hypothetical protein